MQALKAMTAAMDYNYILAGGTNIHLADLHAIQG